VKNIFFFLLVLIADQATKYIAVEYMNWHANAGISFGLFQKFPLWIFFALIILLFLIKIFYKIKLDFTWSLLIAGMSGNLIDRIRLGYVIDWIPLPFPFIDRLYVNIADAALIIGFICFIFNEFKKSFFKQPEK